MPQKICPAQRSHRVQQEDMYIGYKNTQRMCMQKYTGKMYAETDLLSSLSESFEHVDDLCRPSPFALNRKYGLFNGRTMLRQ